MSKRTYPLRIPVGLLDLAEIRSREEHIDKATALRQWLYTGAEEYVLDRLSSGRLTLSHAAELLEMSVYDVQHLARKSGISIGATEEQYRKARETARQRGRKGTGQRDL